mmetsp:Transcript_108664/g.208811  ORF Transcript_108664/g.208811 Transcript_108664/m.208811 type:complete len:80 (+) Transcript_108664:81-320(+)
MSKAWHAFIAQDLEPRILGHSNAAAWSISMTSKPKFVNPSDATRFEDIKKLCPTEKSAGKLMLSHEQSNVILMNILVCT